MLTDQEREIWDEAFRMWHEAAVAEGFTPVRADEFARACANSAVRKQQLMWGNYKGACTP